ncbi:UNVERIFIED_CONTAM: hypothetical protein GTU68_046118 [Idotea baltica]|nr:hypothetical protein [Idotea baltica]
MDSKLDQRIETLIRLALEEDLDQAGDVTSLNFVPPDHRSTGSINARESCVVSGLDIATRVFKKIDPKIEIDFSVSEGTALEPGECALTMSGPTQSILTAERTALNFLQRLSGISTLTRNFVDLVSHTKAEILDTRKTIPGWRLLEKAAVAAGGGTNHRIGLFDAVMVKDNHLVAENKASALEKGIRSVREIHPEIKIELEADTLDQVKTFLALEAVDVILLDNMTLDQLRTAVAMRDESAPTVLLEASGGVNLTTAKSISETGVDYISIGALTHSATAVDLGLDLKSS